MLVSNYDIKSFILLRKKHKKHEKNIHLCHFDILKAINAIFCLKINITKLNLRLGIDLSVTSYRTEVVKSVFLASLNS